MIRNQEYYLNGGCAIYAIALNELSREKGLELPLYVAKIKSASELETHVFVYDKKIKKGLDASGYFSLDNSSIIKVSKISKKDLLILNKLHLIKITRTEISEAKKFIKTLENRKNPPIGFLEGLYLLPLWKHPIKRRYKEWKIP